MKLQFWMRIVPHASMDRLLDLYTKDSQSLKFACLLAIKIAGLTKLQYSIVKTENLTWKIQPFEPEKDIFGYVVDSVGNIFKTRFNHVA